MRLKGVTMRWLLCVLLFSSAPLTWAEALESGISRSDLVSLSDLAAWTNRDFSAAKVDDELYQEPMSGGSYRIYYEAGDQNDVSLYFEAIIAPAVDAPELDFDRVWRRHVRENLDDVELVEIPDLEGIGERSAGYSVRYEGEIDGFAVAARNRNVILVLEAEPHDLLHPELVRQWALITLDRLARVEHEPELGLLSQLTARNISTERLYRYADYARDQGLAVDQSTLEESLTDRYEPGHYRLNYSEPRRNWHWSLIVFPAGDADGPGEMLEAAIQEMTAVADAERIRDRQFDNWNDGSAWFEVGDEFALVTAYAGHMFSLFGSTIGTPEEVRRLIDPYLDDLFSIEPLPGPSAPDSCVHANDGTCDEPGLCPVGSDTTDCSSAPGPDSCMFANDGACDEPLYCRAGTDTTDCTSVGGRDSCVHANDGTCDEPDLCAAGTDTTDCETPGQRANSCQFAFDSQCDEPTICAPFTDTGDCRADGTDSCTFANDGDCDEPTLCDSGTDNTDCRGPDSCRLARNGQCDEPYGCEPRTDTADCGMPVSDSCPAAENGTCDVPGLCEIGTDSSDCESLERPHVDAFLEALTRAVLEHDTSAIAALADRSYYGENVENGPYQLICGGGASGCSLLDNATSFEVTRVWKVGTDWAVYYTVRSNDSEMSGSFTIRLRIQNGEWLLGFYDGLG